MKSLEFTVSYIVLLEASSVFSSGLSVFLPHEKLF